jgi:hypothetical protein
LLDANALIGSHDVLFVVFDTLRFDVAQTCLREGRTPNLAALLLPDGWERRHSPATFTYAAHQAFFAGFLPTPPTPGQHERLFATRFDGSLTTGPRTRVFDQANIVAGLAACGYHSCCIGGVGFFNRRTALACVLPDLFAESHWSEAMGVASLSSTAHQVDLAIERMQTLPAERRLFLFLNVSALHQPNRGYLPGATEDSVASQQAALAYVDAELGRLVAAQRQRAPALCILCSDHGTCYGEDGYQGHRVAHPKVWEVPYAECVLS